MPRFLSEGGGQEEDKAAACRRKQDHHRNNNSQLDGLVFPNPLGEFSRHGGITPRCLSYHLEVDPEQQSDEHRVEKTERKPRAIAPPPGIYLGGGAFVRRDCLCNLCPPLFRCEARPPSLPGHPEENGTGCEIELPMPVWRSILGPHREVWSSGA